MPILPTSHRRRPTWHARLRPLIRFSAATVLIILASGGSVGAIYAASLTDRLANNAVDISNGGAAVVAAPPGIGEFDGGFNVLAVGADNVDGQSEAFGERTGSLNDVNILLHVSADHQSAVVISLPRDLVIPGPACVDPKTQKNYPAVSAQMINTSFQRGGLGCVVATVSELTGLDIPYAGLFSFEGTVAMSDAVGGVPVCLISAINDPASGLDLPAGTSVVQGQQALAYLRARKEVGDGGDLGRISSQQAYMSSLMRVMKSSDTLSSPGKLIGLAEAATENVKLSTSLAPLTTMVSLALALKDLDLDQMTFVTYPTLPDPADPNRLVPDDNLAAQLMDRVTSDESFVLGAEALRGSVTTDPALEIPEIPLTDAEGTAVPDDVATTTPVIDGLQGQSASQQTCSVAKK
ncbi:MAG: LytR family transcriptional regulator [Glaciihabitans sp.]|nr:LytR family transcriptional regulator [Glaciihabitans sp.]